MNTDWHVDAAGNLYDMAGALVPPDQIRQRIVAELEEIAYQEYWRVWKESEDDAHQGA